MVVSNSDMWLATSASDVDCLCLGTGRFLRSVLVPALVEAGFHPALIQTRGRTMLDYMAQQSTPTYPVDTVLHNGSIEISDISCWGACSLGTPQGKSAVFQQLLPNMKTLSILGVGVTESGLASPQTQVMKDLYELLNVCRTQFSYSEENKLCIINMDNVPNNGSVVKGHMLELAFENEEMKKFLEEKVAFLDTMVDRITSQREGSNGMIPRCEPVPAKALVILDPHQDLPYKSLPSHLGAMATSTILDSNQIFPWKMLPSHLGVLVRSTAEQLQGDIALKLRVANGTHTAMAHALALCKLLETSILSSEQGSLWMEYLDSLFEKQILTAAASKYGEDETKAAYQDWRGRLCHAHFGLSTFFITQNGAAKGGIRLGPTVMDLLLENNVVTVAMAYAFAALLQWLTPCGRVRADNKSTIYRGWLEGASQKTAAASSSTGEAYADGLHRDLEEGWYEFRCACNVYGRPLSEWLDELAASPQQPQVYVKAIHAYLTASDGGNLSSSLPNLDVFVHAVSTLYSRMVAGDGMLALLQEMKDCQGVYNDGFATDCRSLVDTASLQNGRPLPFRVSPFPVSSNLMNSQVSREAVASVMISEVASVEVIDLHTHLLPPSHGSLCCWGIDELLTYHYLVAEYFMTAPSSMTPEAFYAMSKKDQADAIWKALFIDRSPVSEACRGVITTVQALGLQEQVQARDLEGIRRFYREFRDNGLQGAEDFSEMIYKTAGVKYAIMTNIPFDANEVQYWRPNRKEYPHRYRSALRVDPLLAGDRETVENALKANGYDVTLEGARQFLRDWIDTMKPEYMMASTPHYMVMLEGSLAGVAKKGVNEEAMKEPFAFVDATSDAANCDPEEDNTASAIDENSDFVSDVLMKVCEERDLPVALKIGAHRGVNLKLKTAGDGVVAFADAGVLARLCSRFPKVRFLATFLSRNNQHEACVLASKFRNLHLYGCWWFVNNPSMIEEITQMRVEMLGTAFTAQHSDARVLDQLVYKWSHSRSVIAGVLATEYAKLVESGWTFSRSEIRRDVKRLFGGSYEEFMAKSFT